MPFELNFSIQLILERLSKESAFVAPAIKKLQTFGKMSIRKKKNPVFFIESLEKFNGIQFI